MGAHQELLAAKMECHGSEDDEMEEEIKALSHAECLYLARVVLPVVARSVLYICVYVHVYIKRFMYACMFMMCC